jgi:flagellar biosynthesis/type III secretory pathway chaperone
MRDDSDDAPRGSDGASDGPPRAPEALAAVRAAMHDLRVALDGSSTAARGDGDRAHADELAGALAERDRHAAELQRQADERLSLIETVSREAADRLAALHETTAAADALREHVARLSAELSALSAETEQLRAAAHERLELLQANDRAYADFKALLRTRLAELSALVG